MKNKLIKIVILDIFCILYKYKHKYGPEHLLKMKHQKWPKCTGNGQFSSFFGFSSKF